jgi:hypothetical protein
MSSIAICAPATAAIPDTLKGGETSTTSAPTMFIAFCLRKIDNTLNLGQDLGCRQLMYFVCIHDPNTMRSLARISVPNF